MNNIIEFISRFIGCSFAGFFYIYVWDKLLNKEKKIKIQKKLLALFIVSLILTLKYHVNSQAIQLLINVTALLLINYCFFTKDIKLSLVSVLVSAIILIISELIFAIIYSSFLASSDDSMLYTSGYNGIFVNFMVFALALLLFNIRKIYDLSNILIKYSSESKNKWIAIYSIFFLFLAVFSTCSSYLQWNPIYVLVINMVVMGLFIFTVTRYVVKQQELEKISGKYETSISSLKEYEVMIDKFRVDTHENKNEFLTIRNMIKDNNDKDTLIKYIDKLVDNKIKDNDKIMKKTAKIPSGGLRATIYSKLCLMDKLKIKYKLNISREVRATDLIDLDEDLVLKICKILGVFLDNAIEAVKGLKKKEISVEMYVMDEELCIDITNNFKGNLDLNKITNMKYTTKGDGHGYGLTLVNKILSEETGKLENEKSINRDTFTQTLKIKM